MLQLLLYVFVSFIITYALYQKGKFENVGKTGNLILTVLGVILLFVDVIETWVGFEFEGSFFVILTIKLVPAYGWFIFILAHVGASVLVVFLGWQGKPQKEARIILTFLVILLGILTGMNAVLLKLYGVL